ncbi:Hypothetical protein SMAX5B_021058 [Scophthalmus maximus]|uniref:Uncharacterized protein n=1 Tax=Scophthalmus maximus TaxID=52904 RepID=A0A2U9CQ87_SCOMX|nr:Hypothetical protein SMAX5B_021058 [Scophthalmus maximus]
MQICRLSRGAENTAGSPRLFPAGEPEFEFHQCGTHWVRQPAGKAPPRRVGVVIDLDAIKAYAGSVQGRIGDNSDSMVNLRLSNLEREDYCARDAHWLKWAVRFTTT